MERERQCVCVTDNKDVTTIIIKPLIQYAQQKIRRMFFLLWILRMYEKLLSCPILRMYEKLLSCPLRSALFRLISAIVEAIPAKVG